LKSILNRIMGKSGIFFNKNSLAGWLFLPSLGIFAFYLVFFSLTLSSLVSDYSWGDVVYHHQIFYNFLHGRPFQTSVYWNALFYSHNPYAYLNMINIHLYLSPFFFSPIYYLAPNLYGLYFTVIAVNYVSLAYFIWKLVCLYTTEDRFSKYLFVMSFVLIYAFAFSLIVSKASPIMLGTPFLLAAYYFLQRQKYLLFYLGSLLFCLSYDDCGLLFISFLPYVYLFERKHLKPALVAAVIGLLSVSLIVGVFQPLGRAGIPGKSNASMFDAIAIVWNQVNWAFLIHYATRTLISLSLFGTLFLIFPVIRIWVGKTVWKRRDLYQCLGFVFLAPLSHWASIGVNVGVHFMPIVIFSIIAITFAVSRSTFEIPRLWTWKGMTALTIIGLYLIVNLFAFGYPKRYYFDKEHRAEKEANLRCLGNIDRLLPSKASLTYWTARSLDGYLGNRSDLWRFPDYFDQTDFLVMQKKAKETFFATKLNPGQDIYQALKEGTYHSSGEKIAIDSQIVEAIRNRLVMIAGSHAVIFDDPEMVILRKKESVRFVQPPETRGIGFFLNFPRYWQAKISG